MEIELADVPYQASVWDVKRAFGGVLHDDPFFDASDPKARHVNLKVMLNPGRGGVQNNGHGVLILPNRKIGDRLMAWIYEEKHPVVVNGRAVRLFRSKKRVTPKMKELLTKTPYLDPGVEELREDKIRKLDVGIHVDKVQFGVFYRPPNTPMTATRVFSTEYEISHVNKGAGMLSFEYDHKLIRIELGDRMTEEIAHNIAIYFSNIRKMAIGIDFGNAFVCFDLITPPHFERQRFNRTLTGHDWNDNRKFRQRLDSLNEAHGVVAPYAHHIRFVLHREEDIRFFSELCVVAGLQKPVTAAIDTFRNGFFTPKRLWEMRGWLSKFDWPVAFQLEALLHNGIFNTQDLLGEFKGPIEKLVREEPLMAADILRHFTEMLRSRHPLESAMQCFKRLREDPSRSRLKDGSKISPPDDEPTRRDKGKFRCCHITFTPTRMVLEGPYVIPSNRVIRQYSNYQDHFIRVDFRDEDRLQYRWAREVDGTSLLKDRVGGILKNGFELAGRRFEFLAYSSSALREHAVWFMNPFDHPTEGFVTSQKIRESLGDFTKVMKIPSKYAARIAQAFTATDPSVAIEPGEWEEVEDLGMKPHLFTDGVGTIAPELGDRIWDALCSEKEDLKNLKVKPCAYQIRFLGYKGMVVVDEQLRGKPIQMRLRESMNKFEALEVHKIRAEIEIARFFERPGTCYLNRALVMILEDRGVDKRAFLDLQDQAQAEIVTATDSVEGSIRLLKTHSLGMSYGLPWILQHLRTIGMGMQRERKVAVLDNSFLESLLLYGKNHVLRDMKHGAKIPIPDSYLLVGVADEGPAYEQEGMENVFKLKQGEIFACVQSQDDPEPIYLKGSVLISRSPVVHPGDVQRVRAIGEPPKDQLCFFRNLKNVVVLPSVDDCNRSLASRLGGGDLDGDLYAIVKHGPLLPTEHFDAADYPPVATRELEDGRTSTVEDICDFVVEYINSDVLGLLSDRHLVIADQSKEGTMDLDCLELARLCSQAVDYPKNGVPVDIFDSPRYLIREKPDWKQAEDNAPRPTDYYISSRALGELFRSITIVSPDLPSASFPDGRTPAPTKKTKGRHPHPLSDAISAALGPYVERQLHRRWNEDNEVAEMHSLFKRYEEELRYICVTHALSDAPDVRLSEEEVAIGTILAQCSQHRWRKDRTHRMRLHSSELVRYVKAKLYRPVDYASPTVGELRYGLSQAWLAWDFGMRNQASFGAKSFSLVALGVVLQTLDKLPSGFTLVDE